MIDLAHLKSLLAYDTASGCFTWRVWRGGTARVGSIAGSKDRHGYIQIKIDAHLYSAHRLAWLYVTGNVPKEQIDHINGVRDDNRFCNLREASHAENARNSKRPITNSSGIKGVDWVARLSKWRAQIGFDGGKHYIGVFTNINDAADAYRSASQKFHKNFGRTDR